MANLTAEWIDSIAKVSKTEWNRLAGYSRTPILDWEWLYALEQSGSIAPRTGWQPCHLIIRDISNRLTAAVPLYIKQHSWGEFVFDFVWADLAERIGREYYPKLIGMSPATPVSGYSFLIDPEADEAILSAQIFSLIGQFCRDQGLNSSALLYTRKDWNTPENYGYHRWVHQNFSWFNRDYRCFEDYLNDFTKNQRRNIRRERELLVSQQLTVKILEGSDITYEHLLWMHRFYDNTNDRFGPMAARFLNRDFFRIAGEIFTHRIVLVTAFQENDPEPVAMSMLLKGTDFLAGRYWGSRADYDALHFNLCYYEPIDYAIRSGISEIDPWLGSENKLRRGFAATPFYSFHRFSDPVMDGIFSGNTGRINQMESERIRELNAALPVKEEIRQSIRDLSI